MELNPNCRFLLFRGRSFLKKLLIMKLILFFLLAMSINAFAGVYAQSVNLSEKNASIKTIFKEIKSQTNYTFVYTKSDIKKALPVTVSLKDVPVEQALRECFAGQPLTFTIYDKIVVIKEKDQAVVAAPLQQPIALVVSGKIVDENGKPLPGATVLEKGTANGVATNPNGSFSIKVSNGNAVLVVSFVGYERKEVAVNGQSSLTIALNPANSDLEQVVVVGYGTQKKSDLTGSIASVSSKDIQGLPVDNVVSALEGKVAGLSISTNNGEPGSTPAVTLRGIGTFLDNTPLYVVDGQPVTDMNSINTNDIQSIDILKDNSAAAIYGNRASNGVVLITTKRGSNGKPVVSLDSYAGVSSIPNPLKMLNSSQLYSFLTESYANANETINPDITKDYDRGYNTNWFQQATRNAVNENYNLAVRGGNDIDKYSVSAGYYDDQGTIKTSDFSRISLRVTNDINISKNISIGETVGLSYDKTHTLNVVVGNPLSDILLADPFSPVINPNVSTSDPNYQFDKYAPTEFSYQPNPISSQAQNFNVTTAMNIVGNIFANVKILPGLNFKTLFGMDKSDSRIFNFQPTFALQYDSFNVSSGAQTYGQRSVNYLYQNDLDNFADSWQNTLTYDFKVKKSTFSLLAGMEMQDTKASNLNTQASGLPGNAPSFQVFSEATGGYFVTGGRTDIGEYSYFGRLNYNYDSRYYLTATFRADGSSLFAPGHQWGYFPSFSLAWRLDHEKFFQDLNANFISSLKLRGGYGETGNSLIPPGATTTFIGTYSPTQVYAFGGTYTTQGVNYPAYGPTTIGNPLLKWESSNETNIGLDAGFFNNRLTASADYYVRNTNGLLLQVPLPDLTGYPQGQDPYSNAGSIQNKGFEFSASYVKNTGDFTYNISGNISTDNNKVLSIGNGGAPILGAVSKTVVGQPIGQFYGYVFDGIFQNQAEIDADTYSGVKLQPNARPGDIRFKDNGAGQLEQTFIGNPIPKFNYGLTTNFGYKNFDVSLFFQGVAGNKVWASYLAASEVQQTNALLAGYQGAWRGQGTSNFFPIISQNNPNDNYRASSWWVQDGSFLRFKNAQLGYTLPGAWLGDKKFISSCRIYMSGQNLAVFTKFKGMDPEVGNTNVTNVGYTSDIANYPIPRIISVGVNAKF
jgi:TonB-dependent starch-binding outer membrane protein SusC